MLESTPGVSVLLKYKKTTHDICLVTQLYK